MGDSFGDVLRSVRIAARLSLAALAGRVYVSKAELGHVETGRRRPTPELAEACDRALGTTPLLTTLLGLNAEEDTMRRRTLLTSIATAGAAGLTGLTALAELVRDDLLAEVRADTDWDAVVAEHARRLAVDPGPAFGRSLVAQMLVARRQLADNPTPELIRATAQLGQLYGLHLGDGGEVTAAWGWYRTSTTLADRSGDTAVRVWTRGRAASRGVYEGATVQDTVKGAGEALALSATPTPGAVEAHSALVHVHALTGNLTAGRAQVGGMRDVAERLPDAGRPGGAEQRTVQFAHYLECRSGTWASAEQAWAEAEPMLRPLPVWHADARVYFGLAMVRDGQVDDGLAYALQAVRPLGGRVRIVGVALADLLHTVPSGHRSAEVDELDALAAPGPYPWDTLGV